MNRLSYFIVIGIVGIASVTAFGQTVQIGDTLFLPESAVVDLPTLVRELIMNNQEIERAALQMDIADARIPQEGALDPPQLRFMQEGMPGFVWNEAMYSRLELMQMIPFPGKLGTKTALARIRADHSHHDHLEKINEVIARLKMAYYELWLAQQTQILDRENIRLMDQFVTIARNRYGTGSASQAEVLKAQVERSMMVNDFTASRQRELSAKAMMGSMLDREPKDTIGYAVIPETVHFAMNLDSLIAVGTARRPMIMHDSAMIREGQIMLRMAKQEYLPDITFGIERMTSPMGDFSAWSLSAGITLPFMPWSVGKINAQADEASSVIEQAQASYRASRAMITGNIRDMYYKADAARVKLANFQQTILPQTDQAIEAGVRGYQNGTTDFLMLLDSYRTRTELRKDYFMTRMGFDQALADLEREVGVINLIPDQSPMVH